MKNIEWKDVKKELPKCSGMYIVCTRSGCIMNVHYSEKFKAFNADEKTDAHALKNVRWWAEMPDLIEEDDENDDNFDSEKFCMLTCIQPDEVLLDAIEKIYEQEYENYGSFEDFCEDFRCNKNGLFSKAQVLANGRLAQLEWKIASVSEMIDGLRKKVSELENGMCEKIAEFDDALRSTVEYVESINDFRR